MGFGYSVVGNILAPMMINQVRWYGWASLWWVLGGLAVEVVLFKRISRLDWGQAAMRSAVMNLVTGVLGLVLLSPLIQITILIFTMWFEIAPWIPVVLASAIVCAFIHRFVNDIMKGLGDKSCAVKWLFVINVVGIAIGSFPAWPELFRIPGMD